MELEPKYYNSIIVVIIEASEIINFVHLQSGINYQGLAKLVVMGIS